MSNIKKCDVFTPENITKQMSKFLHNSGSLLEPSVGKGDLLDGINRNNYNIDVFDIEKSYLDCINDKKINKYHTDFLKYSFDKKYKNIILNPPYIKFQELDIEYRNFIKEKWPILSSGNIDIYQAFILKCLNLLEKGGIMVAIIPSTWLYNKSCERFKNQLFENKLIKEIIDFGSKKVFKGINVYTCIVVFSENNDTYIYNGKKENYFLKKDNDSITLNSICKIKYGIATLRDNIYIHDNKLYNEPCWQPIYKVSKDKIRYIIYPYDNNGKIIEENIFKKNNPQTYSYLCLNKEELSNRDRGKKKYETWYAFGRKQGIIKSKNKNCLFISTMGPKNFQIHQKEPILFYSGLIIETEDIQHVIKTIDNNRDIIHQNCSKRGSDWININPKVLLNIIL